MSPSTTLKPRVLCMISWVCPIWGPLYLEFACSMTKMGPPFFDRGQLFAKKPTHIQNKDTLGQEKDIHCQKKSCPRSKKIHGQKKVVHGQKRYSR